MSCGTDPIGVYSLHFPELEDELMRYLLLLLVVSGPACAEWGDWRGAVELAVGHDDNLNLAYQGKYKESDEFVEVGAHFGRSYTFRNSAHSGTRFTWRGLLGAREQRDVDGLSWQRYGGQVQLSHKLGLGPAVPRLTLTAQAHYEDTDDMYREAWYYVGTTRLGQRLTDRLYGSVSARYQTVSGEDFGTVTPGKGSDVYDRDRWELGLDLHYTLSNRVRPTLAVSYLDGDFDTRCGASTQAEFDRLAAQPGVKALAVDDTFDGCRWRLDGDGYRVELGADLRLASQHLLQLKWEYTDLEIDSDQDYDRNVYRLRYRYSL